MIDLNVMATNIKQQLELVDGINQAFDHEPDKISNFPAATIFFNGFSQTEATTRRSEVGWEWIIRIYVPIRTSDIKQPQVQIRNLIQNTIHKMREDYTIGGSCLFHTIANGEVSALLEQNNPLLVVELSLRAITEE